MKIKTSFKNRLKTVLTGLNNKISDSKIDFESFLLLHDQAIEKLIKNLRPQLKFKKKFQDLMQGVFNIIYTITNFFYVCV